jgi:hypothetical protein
MDEDDDSSRRTARPAVLASPLTPHCVSEPQMESDVVGRRIVFDLMAAGRAEEAEREVVQRWTRSLLDTDSGLDFKIKVARFCEIVRKRCGEGQGADAAAAAAALGGKEGDASFLLGSPCQRECRGEPAASLPVDGSLVSTGQEEAGQQEAGQQEAGREEKSDTWLRPSVEEGEGSGEDAASRMAAMVDAALAFGRQVAP